MKQLEKPNLDNLQLLLENYVDYLESNEYWEDSDRKHELKSLLFDVLMKTFYGEEADKLSNL